jgi:hypothetical protein
MSTPVGRDLTEVFQDFLTAAAKFLFWLGVACMGASIALLGFTIIRFGGDNVNAKAAKDALTNVGIFQKVLSTGTLGMAISSTYLFWGSEFLAAGQLLTAALLYFAPLYFPMLVSNTSVEAVQKALGAMQEAGTILGAIAVVALVADVATRTRQRVKTGVKADQLKYGKGIREEGDKQNVFMGKCWQLPYCRKFVRERCPIFHSKRTCWKELTGCMCEEEVIRNAMENKVVPKDALLAAKMIPRNQRLTPAQKFERCKSCVIYNEHQRHKYRAYLPTVLLGFIAVYVLLRGPLLESTKAMIDRVNHVLLGLSYGAVGKQAIPPLFVELLLVVFFVIALTYALKLLELAIFKLKV